MVKACPLPAEPGIYWLKFARKDYGKRARWRYGWLLAGVRLSYGNGGKEPIDPKIGYNIEAYMGSDDIGHWDGDPYEGIIVKVGPKVEAPKD